MRNPRKADSVFFCANLGEVVDKALAQTIKAELARTGKKLTPLAKRHALSPDILSNMVNGRTAFTDEYLSVLRKELAKPKAWPLTAEPLAVSEIRSPYGRRVSLAGTPLAPVPIIGTVSAGPGSSNVDPDQGVIYVPQRLADLGGLGWIVDGDSGMPILQPGDVTIFREWRKERTRIPFLIRVADGELRVKRLKWLSGHWHLEDVNKGQPPEPMKPGDELLGYLIGLYRYKGSRETIDSDPEGLDLEAP
jgi:hypothetical protein